MWTVRAVKIEDLDAPREEIPRAHRELVGDEGPSRRNAEKFAREKLESFVSKAYRRPARKGEVDRLVALMKQVAKEAM